MFNKYGGSTVSQRSDAGVSVEEALLSASAQETLVAEAADGSKVLIGAALDAEAGGLRWAPTADATTQNTVVAMSQMASMLRDADRCNKYEAAIAAAVAAKAAQLGRPPRVLDVGAGTGLLSLFAARAGAESVTAFEMFPAMADIASQVCAAAGAPVAVVPSLSTAHPLDPRADLLVTETFDSALLGEGVLPSVRFALEQQLTPGASVVPQGATVTVQLLQCEAVHRMQALRGLPGAAHSLNPACFGAPAPIPLHAAELRPPPTPLSAPTQVMAFDFAAPAPAAEAGTVTPVAVTASGTVHAVLFWWTLQLWDGIEYSSAPGAENWQDHWVQCVVPVDALEVQAGATVRLAVSHDDHKLSFQLEGAAAGECNCGQHLHLTPQRTAALADEARHAALRAAVVSAVQRVPPQAVFMDVSDCSAVALVALQAGVEAGAMVSLEAKPLPAMLTGRHGIPTLEGRAGDLRLEHLPAPIGILASDQFQLAMQDMPLWQAFNFWIQRTILDPLLAPGAVILPHAAALRARAADFADLASGYGLVGTVCGFDHAALDAVSGDWHARPYRLPLWMYPYQPASEAADVLLMDYSAPLAPGAVVEAQAELVLAARCQAVVLWVDLQLAPDAPEAVLLGHADHQQQLVLFLPEPAEAGARLSVAVRFALDEGVPRVSVTRI